MDTVEERAGGPGEHVGVLRGEAELVHRFASQYAGWTPDVILDAPYDLLLELAELARVDGERRALADHDARMSHGPGPAGPAGLPPASTNETAGNAGYQRMRAALELVDPDRSR